MQNKETIGAYIRRLREERNLPIRKIAAALDIDASTLSKIERDERKPNRAMLKQLVEIFGVSEKELLLTFLSDMVVYEIIEEENPEEILKLAEEKVEYLKLKKSTAYDDTNTY